MGNKLPFEREIGYLMKSVFPFSYHAVDVMGTRYTEKKPADHIACANGGKCVIVEAKATRNTDLPFSRIKRHQRHALNVVEETGGHAFIAINFRNANGPGRAWLIPWYVWLDFEEEWNKKSVGREDMPRIFRNFELERITGGWRVKSVDRRLQIWIK